MRSYGITNAAPYASAPAVGAAGDTYWDTTAGALFVSNGSSWLRTVPIVDDAASSMLVPVGASRGIRVPASGTGYVIAHSTYPTIDRRTGIDADDSTLQVHAGSGGILFKTHDSAAILATLTTAGRLTLTADPSVALDSATKQYVDARGIPAGAGDVGKVLTVAAGPTLTWAAGGGAVVPNTAVTSSTVSVTSGAAIALNNGTANLANRLLMTIQNLGTGAIFVGPVGVTSVNGIKLTSLGSKEFQIGPSVTLYARAETTTCDVRVLEQS